MCTECQYVIREYFVVASMTAMQNRNAAMHPIVAQLMDAAVERGWSERQLAEHAGVCPSLPRWWRRARAAPTLRTAEALARALGYELRLVRRAR